MFERWPSINEPREGQWLESGTEKIWLTWKRHASAKRMKLLVSADGPRLSLPLRAAEKTALKFVAEQQEWIWAQWQKHQPYELTPFSIGDTTPLAFLGEDLPIEWVADRALQIFHFPDRWRIHTTPRTSDKQLRSALKKHYVQLGETWFRTRMHAYLPSFPAAPSAMSIKPLRSIWGSLSASNAMNLDLALLFGPPIVAEYVLVHELCHLLQRNHSPKFWREVEQRWPQWREQRDYLKTNGQSLKLEAKRIFG